MKHVLHIIGARPHFMKLAPIYHLLSSNSEFTQSIIHTGQHYDDSMSNSFITEFGLPAPDHNLEVGSGPHLKQMGSILLSLHQILIDHQPDIVFVYGDTNSTAAGAIAAAKMNIPVAHVESGLREWDKSVPEEINKLLTDSVTDLYFCPTLTAIRNLEKAGISENLHFTGDVVASFILDNQDKVTASEEILDLLEIESGRYILATCHRAANTDYPDKLSAICKALEDAELPVIFLLHPRTQKAFLSINENFKEAYHNIRFIEPVSFWKTQALIKNAFRCVTDSGGLIKESYLHGTPSVIIDTQTEWLEIVDSGWASLAGPDGDLIRDALNQSPLKSMRDLSFICGQGANGVVKATNDFLKTFK